MAERTIGLRIKLNGINTVVSDIETLEKFLKEAREDLKQLEIGSDLFKELSAEISIAQGQLNELGKSAKSIDTKQLSTGFQKFGVGVASSFAAATAAVNLFGSETEDVSKAAAEAQNLLTVALSLRGVIELKTGAQIVARTIAERAATAATVATTNATRVLYATLAANPYTAIIAVVGLLVSAYFALRKQTDETAKEQKTLNELYGESIGAVQGQILQIKNLQSVLNNTNSTYAQQIGAYKELQKLIPSLSNLTLEQAKSQGILNSAIKEEIELIELRAEQKALEDFLVQLKKEEIQKQIIIRQSDELRESLEKYNRAVQSGFVGTFEKYQKQQKAISNTTQETRKLSVEEERLLKVTQRISEITGKRTINTNNLTQAQSNFNKFVTNTISKIRELGKALTFNYGEPKVLNDLREIDKELKRLVEGPESFDKKLEKTFKTGGADIFGTLYDGYREQLSKALLLGGDELGKTIQTVTSEAAEKVQTGEFNIEAFVALQSLTSEYANLQKIITEIPDITKALGDTKYYNALKGQLIQTGQIIFQEVDGNIQLLDKNSKEYLDSLTKGTSNFQETEKQLRGIILKSLLDTGKFTKEQAEEITNTRIEAIKNLSTTIVVQEEKIRGVLFETQKISKEIDNNLNNNSETFKNFVLENIDLLSEQYKKVGLENKKFFQNIQLNAQQQADLEKKLISLKLEDYKGYFQQRKIDAEDLVQVELLLAQKGIDLEKFTADEKIKIIESFYNKIKGFREQNTFNEEESLKNFLANLGKGIQILQTSLADIGNIIAQGFELQLDKIERNYSNSLELIVGDTEEANQKRLELEQQYQSEKAEIEKKSRIRSLEFQLAQSIADGAASVIRTLAEFGATPVGLGLSVLAGALTAAQVGIVQQQLDFAKGLAGGGLIRGKSHEMGGVFAGGGYSLEGGEAVLNRNTTMDYLPLLSTLNQQGGGQPLISNASNSLMEERLLQAIAKTRNEPLRAYVLGSEITNSQAINRRLEELSTL
jgi:preprotein translocase subunit YajC